MGTIICFLFLATFSFADEVPNHPGWFIETPSEDAEGFALKPGDNRPPVGIDAATMEKIKAGELDPSVAYRSATQNASKMAVGEDNVYGKGNAITQVDAVLSTAPMEFQKPETHSYGSNENTASTSSTGSSSSLPNLPLASNESSGSYRAPTAVPYKPKLPVVSENAAVAPPAAAPANVTSTDPGTASATQGEENSSIEGSSATIGNMSAATTSVSAGNKATGFGFSSTSGAAQNSSSSTVKYLPAIDLGPCNSGRVVLTTPGAKKLGVAKGCNYVTVTAWGAGGGSFTYTTTWSSSNGSEFTDTHVSHGGGGAYVMGTGQFDGAKYDLYVVVGGAGKRNGDKGISGGGEGGTGGAGGGGYSALMLAPREGGTAKGVDLNLVVAAGGGGAGGSSTGYPGGLENGGGGTLGGTAEAGGLGAGGATSGSKFMGGNGATGGGGGGGLFGGAGGNRGGGGGGSSFTRLGGLWAPGHKGTGGQEYMPDRNKAGDSDHDGKVIVEWY